MEFVKSILAIVPLLGPFEHYTLYIVHYTFVKSILGMGLYLDHLNIIQLQATLYIILYTFVKSILEMGIYWDRLNIIQLQDTLYIIHYTLFIIHQSNLFW